MSDPGFDPGILASAGQAQSAAANPDACVFVEANAGSGKTRVLVDRVSRILLGGCPPERILCVTYTKAAAAEMQSRLFERLGQWSVMEDEALRKDLIKLTGEDAHADLPNARRLFARALETPGGLKVQTIHAFCENLLRRFPLEAGIPPGFETLDESAAEELVASARKTALSQIDPHLIATALDHGGVEAIDTLFRFSRSNRQALRAALNQAGDAEALVHALYDRLDLPTGITADQVRAEAWNAAPHEDLRQTVNWLLASDKKTDLGVADHITAALNATGPKEAYELYTPVFFKATGGGLRVEITTKYAEEYPAMEAMFGSAKRSGYGHEVDRMQAARERVRAAQCAEASAAAIRICACFLDAYETGLARQRALDFDDLIARAGRLLSRENAFAGWVAYKMDKGLDHALIDEAQDTAPVQWDMIAGLTEEFFAGAGARTGQARTLFAVGDEKQSIYSFQGADPKRFLAEGEALAGRAAAAGMEFDKPELTVSFRSAPEVLDAVDQAFEEFRQSPAPETKFLSPDTPDLRPFQQYHGHRAARRQTPGCVEFWPAIPVPEKHEEASIFEPVDARPAGSARDQLARAIACEVSAMIGRGDPVWQEGPNGYVQRPVRPSDIGILVWRRTGGFFEELIRQLKLAGVPVAGADRMVLRDQTAVKDLLALARLAVTSGDDLALAECLKSPFFDPADGQSPLIDDDALFDLAHPARTGRRGYLWPALLKCGDPRFTEARDALKAWRNRADTDGVYSVFAAFLNQRTPTGETRWARMLARLGEEARDPIEEFLNRALEYEHRSGGSMAGFVAAIDADAMQLKRELSTDRDEVQVMTVHASKGLERPVIILPDTTRSPLSGRADSLFLDSQAGLYWSPRKDDDPAPVSRKRAERSARQQAEHGRLLYVALTRARDRLIVCGWKQGGGTGGKVAPDSWYARLEETWRGEGWSEFDTPVNALDETLPPGRRFGPPPQSQTRADVEISADKIKVPDWARTPAPVEPSAMRAITPSSFLAGEDGEPAVRSPLDDPDGSRFRRGEVIHKLLETLPDIEPDRRRDIAMRFVASQDGFEGEVGAALIEETLAVLDHPDFSALFGPGSRAEVSLTGSVPGLTERAVVRGQVDRLVVTDHEVLIVDYKTNRPPPERVEDVAPIYLGQMAAYRALLQAIHPDKTVRCALLWTDAGRLMELPPALLDATLAKAPA